MSLAKITLNGLATYRVTKLIIDDEIFTEVREKVLDKFPPHETKIGYLLTCPWCVSMWAAAGFYVLDELTPQASEVMKSILASSAITGLVYN